MELIIIFLFPSRENIINRVLKALVLLFRARVLALAMDANTDITLFKNPPAFFFIVIARKLSRHN
jgi:hypothetical protein